VAILTFVSLNANININPGAPIYTGGGLGFTVINGLSLVPSNINYYRSTATKFQAQLAYAGITDQYAVEVTVQASAPGSAGNIGQYSLTTANIPGINNVTNIVAFSGGTDQETDAAFRNRVLATFSGSSVGTSLGYLNAALAVTGVQDAVIIGPGNPLMTRDGTVSETINGVLTVISQGSGGKVDVVVLGTNDISNVDTYIYLDHSNDNDPSSPTNNFVLGQIPSNANLSISQKRVTDIANGTLPAQPVDSIIQVTGSVSGSNFVPYTVDGYGRGSGNYQLIKDTGVYAGSPFGFDTFAWTSNQVDYEEDLIKGQTNGQDATTFTGVIQIPDAQQQLGITSENSTVTTDRSIIQLLHTPATNVTRVFNTNTGERYLITNQNYNGTTPYNNTGLIQISGNTLPSPSDILQVDYTWVVDYDRYSDFDGLVDTNNPRPVTDSIDWGYPSDIRNELVSFSLSPGNNYYVGTATHPIDTVLSTDTFLQVDGYVQQVTSGIYVNRLSVVIDNLAVSTATVNSVTLKNSNVQLYNTAQNNGYFSSASEVVGIHVLYNTTIILPSDSDTVAQVNQVVTTYLNATNVFQSVSAQGSSNGNQITIPSSLVTAALTTANVINTTPTTINLRVTYIAAVSDLFSAVTGSLPTSRIGNGYILSNNNGFNNFSIVNISRRENQIVQLNLSNQYYVELNCPSANYTLLPNNILSVVRLSDGYGLELWNLDNPGQVVTVDGNYQLIFSGFNTPAVNNTVLVIYYATDIIRFQPFSFSNQIIKTYVDNLGYDSATNSFTVPLVNFTAQPSGMSFEVMDINSDTVYFSITDGYLDPLTFASPDGNMTATSATISSLSVNFSGQPDLTNKIIKITEPAGSPYRNNDGYWSIQSTAGYDITTNQITITGDLNNITADQISVIRVVDGQELWSYSGTIDLANNRVLIPASANAIAGDLVYVMFFNFNNLRKAPTRVIGTTLDQTVNTGVITVAGTTLFLAQDVVFTATMAGLQQTLEPALQAVLGLPNDVSIPSNVKLARVVNLANVDTYTTGSNIVLKTLATYDMLNTTIADNLYFADWMLSNPSLDNFSFVLPSTANNILVSNGTSNLPAIGDQLQVSFYYTVDNDYENLSYTKIGQLYTNKKFALIDQIYVSSGFKSSQSTKFTATSFTKPSTGARYSIFYDYTAPKQNERILIQYNYNQLIGTTTFAIENSRPINADVLVRAAKVVEINLTMNVVIDPLFLTTQTTVLQNLQNQLTAALTSNTLGPEIDQITLINIAQGVQGIDRARILVFNVNGLPGQVLSIQANQDQYFQSNIITINTESI
jgi:phage-related baseplate assembly protein